MRRTLLGRGRLQRRTLIVILTIVVVPMLVAGVIASAWVSTSFEERLQSWISVAAASGQEWLRAYEDGGSLIGRILVDDPQFLTSLEGDGGIFVPTSIRRAADELEIDFIHVYSGEHELLYSSRDLLASIDWDSGQSQALVGINDAGQKRLAALSITPVHQGYATTHFVVVGSIIDRKFIDELTSLTGMETRLYYRSGGRWLDSFSSVKTPRELQFPSKEKREQLLTAHKKVYSRDAEGGQYRGTYTPLLDSTGHMQAILFAGLRRHGFDELLTNRGWLFLVIVLLGAAIGVLVGILLARMIIAPLEKLRSGVVELAGQNYQTTIEVDSDDEFGELARAFNAMAQSLRKARNDEQLRYQQDKLASLGELSASLAHEIRNPVGVITTAAALLDRPETPAERRSTLIRMIRQESERVSEMVRAFLQLTRHRQPHYEAFDPVEPLRKVVDAQRLQHPDLVVEWNLAHDERVVWADPVLVQQAWTGLVNNAIESMGGGGRLRIATEIAESFVVVTLEDQGPGISAEVLPRLFEPFYSTKEKGSGIGLAIALTLVEICGGELRVVEPKDHGACFGMWLPLHREEES